MATLPLILLVLVSRALVLLFMASCMLLLAMGALVLALFIAAVVLFLSRILLVGHLLLVFVVHRNALLIVLFPLPVLGSNGSLPSRFRRVVNRMPVIMVIPIVANIQVKIHLHTVMMESMMVLDPIIVIVNTRHVE
tara:strand:+ start:253 stop:660 length:408 start_codon:yes stop_codon:yes gene_type:complete